jgi:ribosomal protein S18 acetylase RimI-like enzyme
MNPDIILPYTSADKEVIENLYVFSLRNNTLGFIQDLAYHGSIANTAERYQREGGDFFVLKHEGKIVGIAGLRKINSDECELCKLHVDMSHHGKGFGRLLGEHLIKTAASKGFKQLQLHVTNTQIAAIVLYEKLGFERTKQEVFNINLHGTDYSYHTIYMKKALD